MSHRDLRPCVARTPLASGTITCALSVETNSFVRGAFVEAGTFLPSFVGKVSRDGRDRIRDCSELFAREHCDIIVMSDPDTDSLRTGFSQL